ncbi:MAG TPA: hypothetical protein VJC03_04280, partial [bacterium]|nr:hypothetical protein [bacterium]
RHPGLGRWKEIWDAVAQRYGEGHLHISGGEPFIYPDFISLAAHLIKNFTVEFDTNLSFDVDEFMAKVGTERVKFATAFHPRFADFEIYIGKLLKLKKAGYDLGVNYVAYPEQLAEMGEYRKRFEEVHISFDIMPFRGTYRGREYPEGYTEEEKRLLRSIDPRTASRMLDVYAGGENKGKPLNPHKGKKCRMGQVYVKIHPDGQAYRCCLIKEKGKKGNIIEGTFAFDEDPQVCDLDKCPCWVAMVVGEEDNWLFHWKTPHPSG